MGTKRAGLLLVLAAAAPAAAETARTIPAHYPEGPLWRGETLYYAEMGADRVMRVDARGGGIFFARAGCGPTAIAPYGDGFLVLCHLSGEAVAVAADGAEGRIWTEDAAGRRLGNPNDAAADGAGGVYFSDSGPFRQGAPARGRVMHLSAGGALTRVAGPLHYPNGVAVHGGGLYVSEHLKGRILRYRIAPGGGLSGPEIFADLGGRAPPARYETRYPLAGPDGLDFASDGSLYVALYGEGRLFRISPEGAPLAEIEAGTRFVTSLAFGPTAVAVTGAFDNRTPPFPGEVAITEGPP